MNMSENHGVRLPLAYAVAGLLCAGCVPAQQQKPTIDPRETFDSAALTNALQPGHSIITGQAFATTVGGQVRYGAGVPVYLVPMTPYSEECARIMNGHATSSCGRNLADYRKTTTADAEGRFKFPGLLPGRWYLEASITWGVPTQLGVATTGGTFSAIVEIPEDGQTVEAIVH
jgi:hypothetical protein